jgi:hypothetical protein
MGGSSVLLPPAAAFFGRKGGLCVAENQQRWADALTHLKLSASPSMETNPKSVFTVMASLGRAGGDEESNDGLVPIVRPAHCSLNTPASMIA